MREAGFSEAVIAPTLVVFRNPEIDIDIYHGRQSFELGAGITYRGRRYAIEEIIRELYPEHAKIYHVFAASSVGAVSEGVRRLADTFRHFTGQAWEGDPNLFAIIDKRRLEWAEAYAMDVLESQLRPQAAEAFRRGDYAKASELYGRIRDRLTPAEAKKLAISNERLRR